MKNHRIEPMEHNHATIGWIYMDQFAYHYSLESLFFLQQDPSYLSDRIKTFTIRIISNNKNYMIHPWIKIRTDLTPVGEPKTICRALYSFKKFDSFFHSAHFHSAQTVQKSSVRFLSIEYYHEKNPNAERIVLSIDHEYLYEMNELFMPAFIMHMLEHQDLPFYFGMEYTLHIMDNNINIIKLKSNQYLLLKIDTYNILQCDNFL